LIYETFSEAVKGQVAKDGNLRDIYEKMEYAIIDRFGVPEKVKSLIYKQRDIIALELQEIEGDTSIKPLLAIYRSQLDFMSSEMRESTDVDKENARLRRIVEQEYGVNMDRCTVFEFYVHVKDLEEKQREYKVSQLRKVS
jgi:hypothetical protein